MEPSPAQGLQATLDDQGPITFGRYKLVRRIGAGGMGEVFLARDDSASQPRACVVKKVLRHLVQNPNFVNRFLDESKVVVRLNHPNIARVYAMGEVAGEYFLAMEYVQGKTVSRFARRLRDKKQVMPVGMVLLLGERICQGLAYAHEAVDQHGVPLQLVHRDLSPANVCVGYRGEVKIIDFGAAQSTLKESQTAPRVVIGNLTYMAPEQAQKHHVDRRADVYSLGVTLWELFVWNPLPQKGDPLERWRKAANPTWEPISQVRPGLPPELDAVIGKALNKNPAERYADAREFGRALAKLRARIAPEMNEEQLARALSGAFSKEKVAEDDALAELLGGVPLTEAVTAITRRMTFVPPTALAFEHRVAVAAPDLRTDPGLPPETFRRRATSDDIRESRVGFGVQMPVKPEEEQLLLRELMDDEPDGGSEPGVDISLESLVGPHPAPELRQQPPTVQLRPPRGNTPGPRLPVAPRAPAPDEEQTEHAVPQVATPLPPAPAVVARRRRPKVGWQVMALGAAIFVGALAVGFVTVWLLAS